MNLNNRIDSSIIIIKIIKKIFLKNVYMLTWKFQLATK